MFDNAADVEECILRQIGILVASEKWLAFDQIDWWTYMPDPLSPAMGFGMKVADTPMHLQLGGLHICKVEGYQLFRSACQISCPIHAVMEQLRGDASPQARPCQP